MADRLSALRSFPSLAARVAGGIALCLLLFGAARLLSPVPGFHLAGTLGLSLFLGAGWRLTAGLPAAAVPGVKCSASTLLRLGIVLLGVRLDFGMLLKAGLPLLVTDLLVIAAALAGGTLVARFLRLPERLGWLLATGTAVCGASAIAAAAPLLEAEEAEVSQAVGIISILGALAVVLYTLLHSLAVPDAALYGLFTGATLQEVGHVLAAAAAGGATALDAATLAKLTRVALLAPVLLFVTWFRGRRSGTAGTPQSSGLTLPPFLLGFLALGAIASSGLLTPAQKDFLEAGSLILTGAAMAAIGLGIDPAALRKTGSRAVMTAAAGFLVVALVAAATLAFAGHF